jgi:hypothetical protein
MILKAGAAQCRVALSDSNTEANLVASPSPFSGDRRDGFPHFDRQAHATQRRVLAGDRIVENQHEPVTP